jgi:hypothetical protein
MGATFTLVVMWLPHAIKVQLANKVKHSQLQLCL